MFSFQSCSSASPPPVLTLLLLKHNRAIYQFFLSPLVVLSSLSDMSLPPFFCPLLDVKVGITNLVFRIIPPRLLEPSHLPVSAALALSQLRGKTPISLSLSLPPLYRYLPLSIPPSPSPSLSLPSRCSSPHSVSTAAALCLPPLSLFRQAVG